MRYTLVLALLGSLLVARADGQVESVSTAVVTREEVVPRLTLVGAIHPARRSLIGSAVDGRVVSVFLNDGDAVKESGQPIAQLLTSTIEIEIAAAEAEANLRREELGELKAGTRPEERDQAIARRDSAKALKDYADARFSRLESLYQQEGTVSREEFEEANSAALAANQNYLAAAAAALLAKNGPRQERILQAVARLAGQQEEVNRLVDLKSMYTIRAPFPGYVVAKHTEVGAWVSKGDLVAEVIELEPVEVEVAVPENFISEVHIGDKVSISINVLSAERKPFEKDGTVARIIPKGDLRSRSFPVKIRLDNPKTKDGHLLKAGMLARATLSGTPYSTLVVPKEAIIAGRGATRVVAIVKDSTTGQAIARVVSVERGLEKGNLVEVRGELKVGQQLVTRGKDRIRSGQVVNLSVSRTR
jgi:HlyD family secretion protein